MIKLIIGAISICIIPVLLAYFLGWQYVLAYECILLAILIKGAGNEN